MLASVVTSLCQLSSSSAHRTNCCIADVWLDHLVNSSAEDEEEEEEEEERWSEKVFFGALDWTGGYREWLLQTRF